MNGTPLFMDTAYVLALLNPNDAHHQQARAFLPRIHGAPELWTTEAILVEIGNALARSDRSAAVAFINSCYVTPNVNVVIVDRALMDSAVDLYRSREDKEWGLTDCISFIVMRGHGLTEALTADKHFQQAGFRVLLQEEI